MHTTIIITFGLVLLALMLFIGENIGFSRQTLTYSFIVLWLALTMINGAIGVVTDWPAVTTPTAPLIIVSASQSTMKL